MDGDERDGTLGHVDLGIGQEDRREDRGGPMAHHSTKGLSTEGGNFNLNVGI